MTTLTFPTWAGRDADVAELLDILGHDQAAIGVQAAAQLPPGLYGQPYLDTCPSERAFALYCAEWKAAGGVGMAVHGTSVHLEKVYPIYAGIIVDAGLIPVCVAGMNSDDMDGKAERLGAILARDDCHALGHDLEGKGEDESAPMEWAHAMLYVRTLRDRALPFIRSKMLFDQPWPVPTKHWSSFPYEPFAAVCKAPFPQYYEEDFVGMFGHARHAKCTGWFNGAWDLLEARLLAQGIARPRHHTIQGYGYADGVLDGLRFYLAESLTRPVFMWTQWRAIDIVMREIRAINGRAL